MKIEVQSTHDLSQLTLQIVAKGEVVVSKVVDGQNKKKHQIEFIPTLSMVPTANVIVYYITKDGEIISDSLKVEFGNELRNFVRFFMNSLETVQDSLKIFSDRHRTLKTSSKTWRTT